MKTVFSIVVLVSSLLTACSGSETFAVKTSDGLSLQLSPDGRIDSLSLDGKTMAATSSGGISIRVAGKDSPFQPITGTLSAKAKALHFVGKLEGLHLAAQATYAGRADRIEVEGTVRNLAGTDPERCLDLRFGLPVDCRGWQWGTDLAGEDAIETQREGQKATDVTIYPIAPVSNSKLGAGVSLAVPPTHPIHFDTGAGENGVFITFKIGISDATQPPNETKFRLIIYRHDPTWGFRSSIKCYYDFFREPFFRRRVNKIGAWAWHNPPPSELRNRDLYAFHEAGGETWKTKDEGKHGYEHEGVNLAKSVADYERLAKFAGDEKLGIYSLPYTIIGQRQIYRLPKMPTSRDEALAAFADWTTDKPILLQSPGPSVSFRSVAQLKEIIRNSNIYDEAQQPAVLLRQYVGNTVTFPLNPNPNLFSDFDKLTIAKYTLDDYLPMLFRGSKLIDGCYVDSLGRWCNYNNFRRDHFKYSSVPLTYSGKKPQPCLWNLQSHAEYLWELSRRLHAQGKIVFANGVKADRVMLGFAVDVLGMEGLPNFENRAGFYAARVAAGSKPYCALNGRNSTNPKAWNSCLFLGILIGARGVEGEKMERKYLPAIIEINQAGWEPITLARTDKPAIGIERWGGGKERPVYFTLLNRSATANETTVHIDSRALGLKAKTQAIELVSGKEIPVATGKNESSFVVTLRPAEAIAIRCPSQNSK